MKKQRGTVKQPKHDSTEEDGEKSQRKIDKDLAKLRKKTADEHKEKELLKQPHSFVIHRGKVGKFIKSLETDLRRVLEPNTAKNLKVLKKNNIKDFIVNGAVLGVNNMLVLTLSDNAAQLRFIRFPQGPTLTFRIVEYTLARHVISSQKRPIASDKLFTHSPLVVMNGFNDDASKRHLLLAQNYIQNMFPSVNVDTIQLTNLKRCVMLHYNEETDTIEWRHYAVRVVPAGLNKSTMKIVDAQRKMSKEPPDLSRYKDISDYILNAGNLSESEFEGDQEQVELPQDVSKDTGCRRGETSNVRLYEIGPRLTLQLLKIEEGVDDGEVLYHKFVKKDVKELIELKKALPKKKRMKKKMEQQNEHRVIQRLKAVKESQDYQKTKEKEMINELARRQAAVMGEEITTNDKMQQGNEQKDEDGQGHDEQEQGQRKWRRGGQKRKTEENGRGKFKKPMKRARHK
ncbi:hypothetical protein WR25_19018 isoform A [Diploscapter pachys]|uniref:Brix domain-containing protein n=2 Tax=Diploscapter pachys TaxID=2018661 RepID=A0A2A2KG50_9BILA|nr:hypothetical protein WR25_19018 isoform A [Diploscapter pachys]